MIAPLVVCATVLLTALAGPMASPTAGGAAGTQATAARAAPAPWSEAPADDWIQLFDGATLEGWIPKIRGAAPGEDPFRTFRVEDGKLLVRYDGYPEFGDRFGHLFWREPFSHYVLALEARFVGEQLADAPAWARMNSGVMIHAQPPHTMRVDQDFPISIEVQLLAGEPGESRPTANLCTPGTEVEMAGEQVARHCVESSSRTVQRGEWVRVEVVVAGGGRIEHRVDGQAVLAYDAPRIGGGVVDGYDPAVKRDGEALEAGWIALQSESNPVEFRRIELLSLRGCGDPASPAYRPYFAVSDPAACR